MSNMSRLKLHPVVDEWKCFTFFPIRCTGGMRWFNSLVQSNTKESTPTLYEQIYFDLNLGVFLFFSEANLSIITTPHHLTVNLSNRSGFINNLSKSMIYDFKSMSTFFIVKEISNFIFSLNVMLKISAANCCSSILLLPNFPKMLDK